MLNHLKLKHPSDFSETPEKAKQSSMNEFVNSPRSHRFSYIIKLTQVLVIDLLPTYERKSFYTTSRQISRVTG